ncbi:MAG: SPOR domain-containing protein [Pseudomonadota bacterium]
MQPKSKLPILFILVIIAMLVIILPNVLPHKTLTTLGFQYPMPQKPTVNAVPLTSNIQTKKSPTALKPQQANVWLLQIGSFADKNNAVALQKKLLKYKFTTTVVMERINKKAFYRVQVGPVIGKKHAIRLQNKIHTELGLSGHLFNYNPIKTA